MDDSLQLQLSALVKYRQKRNKKHSQNYKHRKKHHSQQTSPLTVLNDFYFISNQLCLIQIAYMYCS